MQILFQGKKASPEIFYFICSACVTVVASFQNEFDFFSISSKGSVMRNGNLMSHVCKEFNEVFKKYIVVPTALSLVSMTSQF